MDFMPYVWAVLGLLFILSEFFIPGFVIFFFGAGALLTTLLTALVPGLNSRLPLQILIWLASSGLSLAFLRRYFSRIFKGSLLESEEDKYSGEKARVIEAISPEEPGRISFKGTSWKAVCYDESFAEGETVEILKREGMVFVVTGSILD
jgi:membrane protein implicated in regulation of membrane protease activity